MATGTPELAPAPNLRIECADLVGLPFRWGARGPDAFDCYGLVELVMRRAGQRVPDYQSPTVQEHIATLIERSVPYWTPCEPGPGAVATMRVGRLVAHVGVVLPHGRLVHAWERAGGVTVERLEDWQRRITGFYRFPQQ